MDSVGQAAGPPPARPLPIRGAVVVALLAAVAWGAQFGLTFRGLDSSDSFSYAQIARNLARGRGYVTQETLPYEYTVFDRVPHPELMHPPLQALAVSLVYRLFSPSEAGAVVPAAIAYVLTGPLVFVAAQQAAGPVAGVIAAALYLTHPGLANYGISGLAESLYALLLTAALLLVAAARDERRWKVMLLIGALLGFTDLARETFRYLLPVVLIALWGRREGRLARMVGVLLGFAAVTFPNFARIAAATGSPFTSYGRSLIMIDLPPFEELSWYRTLSQIDPLKFIAQNPGLLEAKVGRNLALLVVSLGRMVSPFLLLAALAAWRWARHPAMRRAAALTFVAFAFQALVSVGFRIDVRHFAPFVPLLAILAGAGVAGLAARHRRIGTAFGVVAIAMALWEPALVRAHQFQRPSDAYLSSLASQHAIADFARRYTDPRDEVISDISEIVAWRADRSTVWFPLTPRLVERIPRPDGGRQFLLLTSIGLRHRPRYWIDYLATDASPPMFAPVAGYRDSTESARLFIRVRAVIGGPYTPPDSTARAPDDSLAVGTR